MSTALSMILSDTERRKSAARPKPASSRKSAATSTAEAMTSRRPRLNADCVRDVGDREPAPLAEGSEVCLGPYGILLRRVTTPQLQSE